MVQESTFPSAVRARRAEPSTRDDGDVLWSRTSIAFSSCNEDSRSELRAFPSIEGRRVFCITAGGGRVLNLLVARPRAIWAVDLNATQNHLLELKIAGLRALDHDGYLRFLGIRASRDRLSTYDALRGALSGPARAFFDDRPEMIARGVLLEGRLERFLRGVSRVLRLGHPFGIARLFDFDDLAAQRRFLASWDTRLWRTVAENVCRRWVMRTFSGDPGFYRHVPEEVPLHRAIYEAVHRHFQNELARDNPVLQLAFFGRYVHESALPIYLNAVTFDRVKAALGGVHIERIEATAHEVLDRAGPAAFDAFSLSDISSYLDDDAHHSLFERVLGAARSGARVCSRSNIRHRPLAREHALALVRDAALERRNAASDHACVHEFLIGEAR